MVVVVVAANNVLLSFGDSFCLIVIAVLSLDLISLPFICPHVFQSLSCPFLAIFFYELKWKDSPKRNYKAFFLPNLVVKKYSTQAPSQVGKGVPHKRAGCPKRKTSVSLQSDKPVAPRKFHQCGPSQLELNKETQMHPHFTDDYHTACSRTLKLFVYNENKICIYVVCILTCQYTRSLLHHFLWFIFPQQVIRNSQGVQIKSSSFWRLVFASCLCLSFSFSSCANMSIHVFSVPFMSFPFLSFHFLGISCFLSFMSSGLTDSPNPKSIFLPY